MKKLKKEDFKNWWGKNKEAIKFSVFFTAGVGMALLGAYVYDEKIVGYNKKVAYVFDKCKGDCYTIGLCRMDKKGEPRKDVNIFGVWPKEEMLSMLKESINMIKRDYEK